MNIFEVRNLTLATQSGKILVQDLSFSLEEGASLAVVGQSGSGKSLTALAALGLLPPSVKQIGGEVFWRGVALTALSSKEQARMRGDFIAAVFQDAASALHPLKTIGSQLHTALRLKHILAGRERQRRCEEALLKVGITSPQDVMRRYPHELSGGMNQRVLIALVSLIPPKVLICDEPTTGLDSLMRKTVLSLLGELCEREKTALIMITHDLRVAFSLCRRAVVVFQGRKVDEGAIDELSQGGHHPYTAQLVQAARRKVF